MPLLTLVTMCGEWAEFNPWQIPMCSATPGAFELMGVTVLQIQSPDEAAEVVSAGASLAFDSDRQVAVLISRACSARRMGGAKIMLHSFGSLDNCEAVKALLAARKDLLVVTGLGFPIRRRVRGR
jgi:hypothetical protein